LKTEFTVIEQFFVLDDQDGQQKQRDHRTDDISQETTALFTNVLNPLRIWTFVHKTT